MNSTPESSGTPMSHHFRARSNSLDIFTMSPFGSPSLDTLDSLQDNVLPNLRLPEPPVFDLDPGVTAGKARGYHFCSPPSTPNSTASFSFSPPLRANVSPGERYIGTSYSTDMTSLVGSWTAGVGRDGESPPTHADKGKGVERESLTELETAFEPCVATENKGKGKGREDKTPFEFDFDFQQREGVVDLSSDLNVGDPPVVRLSPGTHYRQFSESSARASESVLGDASVVASVKGEPSPRPSSPVSSPSSIPSSDGLSSEERQRSRFPTHRRSFSSLSILSIRSSSTRSLASIRSVVSGAASIRGRVKSMTPAAKKLKGGLRKMFRRPNAGGFEGPEDDDIGSVTDRGEPEPRLAFDGRPQGHMTEASAESQMTVTPAPSGVVHITEAVVKDTRSVPTTKPRSMSAPAPLPTPDKEGKPVRTEVVGVVLAPQNRFNDMLPRELQLAVLCILVAMHEVEHARAERDDGPLTTWSARVAGRTRWVGRDKGLRELVKLTRVSKTWRALAFDGQLWSELQLASYPPHLSPALLLRIAEHAGSFVRSLDLRGWNHLDPVTLRALVRSLAHDAAPLLAAAPPFPATNLTHVALRTCTALTAHSIHHVLLRAPALRSVDLHGLHVVTNTTCGVLATHCPLLESADLRRCLNMDGEGLVELVGSGLERSWGSVDDAFCVHRGGVIREAGRRSKLRVLRVSGIRGVDEGVMTVLAQCVPDLEVLDLSGARELTDDAIAAFVAWDENWDLEENGEDTPRRTKVQLNARQMGRDPTIEYGPFYKRSTRLRHISLSGCILLTDMTCTHLAHCVPQLEFFELAGIGADMKDDGLVRLLGTTPRLRRLDLEDACDISDAVLDALDPAPLLEHLVLSYALHVTNGALLALIRRCTRLAVLECDNTRISPGVVREFVRLTRTRSVRGAELVAVDCRAITEVVIKDLAVAGQTRARRGFRHYEARRLGYVDGRDWEFLGGVNVDDCDEARVIVKSFWSWQGVDALHERRRRIALSARRNTDAGETLRWPGLPEDDEMEGILGQGGVGPSMRSRWLGHWTRGPGAGAGSWSPTAVGLGSDEDRGCTIM